MNGVYRLYFTNDTRCYIGSSLNLNTRLRTHILELLNKILQDIKKEIENESKKDI